MFLIVCLLTILSWAHQTLDHHHHHHNPIHVHLTVPVTVQQATFPAIRQLVICHATLLAYRIRIFATWACTKSLTTLLLHFSITNKYYSSLSGVTVSS
jgi:hypothetical protein